MMAWVDTPIFDQMVEEWELEGRRMPQIVLQLSEPVKAATADLRRAAGRAMPRPTEVAAKRSQPKRSTRS